MTTLEKTAVNTPTSNAEAASFAIYTEKLTKNYGSNRGIVDLDLRVNEGEVFGFLGPNGAGKTTTIRLLLNLIAPTSGHAYVKGLESQRDSVEIKKLIGYLPGEFSLYNNLTGAQTLQYFANLRGTVDWKHISKLAERLELDLTRKFRQYSRGNKQKVGIIQAIMHSPRLLILDEPTSGLDPLNQQEFYRILRELRESGTTVFLSSHIMSEVEKTCDRVGIIREGRLVTVGKVTELVGIKSHQIEMSFNGPAQVDEFKALLGVSKVETEQVDGHLVLRCVVKADSLDTLLKTTAKYPVDNFVSREPSLEEIFLDYYRETTETR